MRRKAFVAAVVSICFGALGGTSVRNGAAATTPQPIARGDLVVSLSNDQVDEYTPAGTFVQTLMSSSDRLQLPTGSAFDGSGNLYVTDFSGNQILKRDALSGVVSVLADNTTLGNNQELNAPESIAFNKGYTKMYVSDANREGSGGGINIINTSDGTGAGFLPLPSSSGSEGIGESDWLAFDANSNLFMTNENASQGVMKVDLGAGDIVQPSFVSSLPNIGYALSFDKDGNLWLGATDRILEFNPSGQQLKSITGPDFSLIFAAVFNPAGDRFYAGDLNNGKVFEYSLDGTLQSSFDTNSGVDGLSVAGAAIPPNPPPTSEVNVAPGNEPSIAVDPSNHNHIVVGYNHSVAPIFSFSGDDIRCSWSESTDGGRTWTSGLLPGVAHSNFGGDPTVRFGSDGTLYYTCLNLTRWSVGIRAHSRDASVNLFRSNTGLASDFSSQSVQVAQKHQTCQGFTPTCDTPLDHPSLMLAHAPGAAAGTATQPVVCYTDFTGGSVHLFTRWGDPSGGLIGDPVQVGKGGLCFMSGSPTQVAVSWDTDTDVQMRMSGNGGFTWGPNLHFPTPNLLGGNNTITGLLASPYAIAVPDTAGGIRVIVHDRHNSHGRVYVADAAHSWQPVADLASGDDAFLPSAGNCSDLVGAYDRNSSGYGYAVWKRRTDGTYLNVFATDKTMGPGYVDSRFSYTRIGDYTGVSCAGSTAWAAWTDTHNGDETIHATQVGG